MSLKHFYSIMTVILLGAVFMAATSTADEPFNEQRERMVDKQIAARWIQDKRVIEAMREVPRHKFIPERNRRYAYKDQPVPIGYKQTISQPFIVAYMTEMAQVQKDDKVLEIGTGSGYQAAILAELAKEVYTIEIIQPLLIKARLALEELGYTNIHFRHGDGYQGWSEHAPFDAIIVTAAPEEVPSKLIEQLAIGGRLVIPVGGEGMQELLLITKTEEGVKERKLIPVRFVPLVEQEK